MIPEGSRMADAEADLEGIRQILRTMSPDGIMPPDAPLVVFKYLAVSDERVRSARIDLTSLYTNEFTKRN